MREILNKSVSNSGLAWMANQDALANLHGALYTHNLSLAESGPTPESRNQAFHQAAANLDFLSSDSQNSKLPYTPQSSIYTRQSEEDTDKGTDRN